MQLSSSQYLGVYEAGETGREKLEMASLFYYCPVNSEC